MVTRLTQAISQLINFPLLGVATDETPTIRDLITDDYIVRYQVASEKQVIYILRIWHGLEDER